jgi:LysR family hydrogen peroxide-inducible transcriptional activator
MKRPSIRQLEYFVALEKHQHFGRAANACFVSQSGFSAAIQTLEESLGISLVDRTRRSVVITAAGREIAVYARLVLRDVDALVELASDQHSILSGKLRLGLIPTIAPFLLPRALPCLRESYPQMQLFLFERKSALLLEALAAGEVDAILIALPYDIGRMEKLVLARDRLRLATARDSQLVQTRKPTLASLPDESLLLLEDGHCLRDQAIGACTVRERSKVSNFAGSSLLTVIEMVAGNLGATLIPEMAMESSLLDDPAITTHRLSKRFYRDIALVWRPGSANTSAFRELGSTLARATSKKGISQ